MAPIVAEVAPVAAGIATGVEPIALTSRGRAPLAPAPIEAANAGSAKAATIGVASAAAGVLGATHIKRRRSQEQCYVRKARKVSVTSLPAGAVEEEVPGDIVAAGTAGTAAEPATSPSATSPSGRPRFDPPPVLPTTKVQLLHHIFVASVVVGTPIFAPWALPSLPLVLFMYLYADAYSAVLHAALDREECLDIGVLKSAAVGFQMHHDHPLQSTKGQGLYRLCCDTVRIQWITGACGLLTSTRSPLALGIIVLKWLCCAYGTQVGHYWSHMPVSLRPKWISALQKAHILLPAAHHRAHHTPPYDKNWGIVNGLSNPVLTPVLRDMPFKWLLALWAFMTVFDVALIERLFAALG